MTSENSQSIKTGRPGLAPRLAAAKALQRVLEGENFVPIDASQFADPRDRALVNKLVTSALRRDGHLDVIIEAALSKGIPKRSGLFEAILRIGLAEVLYMPDQADHSALHLSVEVARKDRRAGRFDKLLNGVLRQAQRDAERWQSLDKKLLFPEWLRQDWGQRFGEQNVEKFGDALLDGAALDLTLRDPDDDLVSALGGQIISGDTMRISERDKSVSQMAGYEEGRWWVQDAAAALPARLFSKPSGAKALDLCAAPGGKTSQLCKRGYVVTALDRSKKRLEILDKNLSRLGYQAELVEADVLSYAPNEQFDLILLDAPCSATGTFRRHPEVLWHRTKDDVADRAEVQRGLLARAIELLAPGGELIYCVCSLQAEEGEDQAAWVLHKFDQIKTVPVTADEIDGLEWTDTPEGWVRTHPAQGFSETAQGGLDGFFIARFQRVE